MSRMMRVQGLKLLDNSYNNLIPAVSVKIQINDQVQLQGQSRVSDGVFNSVSFQNKGEANLSQGAIATVDMESKEYLW
ncbi:hypothetical protein PGTUg99_012686 [Puccinia graminis f. sp. tritici]|uniref:Uncharacterized protein n=1 Tax=Puccinia graminis f. sp. tritici TaxID=56615 RepID=A0A5B0NAW7_PUCGR|nr:hypothetical protein PGTUg99_012686 [Puccinia graminis f. sp. tritici]